MNTPSLHRRLMVILGSAVALAWLASAIFTYIDTRRLIDSIIDDHLEESAQILLGVLDQTGAVPNLVATDPDNPLSTRILDALPPGQTPGYFDRIEGAREWRVFTAQGAGGHWVEVAVRQEVRAGFAARVAAHVLHPLWIAVPLLAVLIWGALQWGLGPLDRVAAAVGRRSPADLEPLTDGTVPREIRPLIQALNVLFARIALVRERDRRFAADAAHELRTPLAAIRTNAEVALGARDPQERREALEDVLTGADRATHLVGQLLALARIDGAALGGRVPVDMADVVRSEVTRSASQAAKGGIELRVEEGRGLAPVSGHSELLAVLVRNILANALRHTPAGGSVTIALSRGAEGIRLVIDDTGPGIPPDLRVRVRDRFFHTGPSGSGTGLGLSIVEAIVDLHDGSFDLADRPGGPGLRVVVDLPFGAPRSHSPRQ